MILSNLKWQQNFQRHGASRGLSDSWASCLVCVIDLYLTSFYLGIFISICQ